jgi:hypothetical protein
MEQVNMHRAGTRALRIIAGVMLLLALGSWEYSYYQLLRVVVCGVGVYSAWYYAEKQETGWAWFFGLTAGLFNPFFIVTLSKDTWQMIDLAIGITFMASALSETKTKTQTYE